MDLIMGLFRGRAFKPGEFFDIRPKHAPGRMKRVVGDDRWTHPPTPEQVELSTNLWAPVEEPRRGPDLPEEEIERWAEALRVQRQANRVLLRRIRQIKLWLQARRVWLWRTLLWKSGYLDWQRRRVMAQAAQDLEEQVRQMEEDRE